MELVCELDNLFVNESLVARFEPHVCEMGVSCSGFGKCAKCRIVSTAHGFVTKICEMQHMSMQEDMQMHERLLKALGGSVAFITRGWWV